MTAGTRYRLVVDQGATSHVSAVVFGRDEIVSQLLLEGALHHAAGWNVLVVTSDGEIQLVCERLEIFRFIRAASYGPLDDVR